MNLSRIERLLHDLRLANEVEAAAEMDVADSKSHIAFYKKQLRAREARRDEAKQACQECCDRLGDAINDECAAPLLLVSRADAQR